MKKENNLIFLNGFIELDTIVYIVDMNGYHFVTDNGEVTNETFENILSVMEEKFPNSVKDIFYTYDEIDDEFLFVSIDKGFFVDLDDVNIYQVNSNNLINNNLDTINKKMIVCKGLKRL